MLHESLRDAFVQVSMDGRIVEFNDLYCQMLGYSPDEIRALTYQELTPELWHAFEERIVRDQIIARGYSDIYEKEYRRKDGAIIPVELRTILSRDASGDQTRCGPSCATSPSANDRMRRCARARSGFAAFFSMQAPASPFQTWRAGSSPAIRLSPQCWAIPRRSFGSLLSRISSILTIAK